MDDIPRPAKRSKQSAPGKGCEDTEADVEIMGTTGASKLPHTRFTCPEGSVVPSTSASSVSASSTPPGPAVDTGGEDGSGPQAPPPPEFSCDCQEICIPVRTVISSCRATGCSIPPSKPVVYLAGLTGEQAKHAEDIAVGEALSLFARQMVNSLHPGMNKIAQALKEKGYKERHRPHMRKTQEDGGKLDMAIASRFNRQNVSLPTPWASKWTAHFETFVSRTPLPVTIWEDVLQKHGALQLEQPEDTQLLQVLKNAYKESLIDVEMRAECDPSFTKGVFSVEVVLLTKLLSRGYSLEERVGKSYTSGKDRRLVDFMPVVERLVLHTAVNQNAEVDSSSPTSSPLSSSASYLSPSTSLPLDPSSSTSPLSYGSPPALPPTSTSSSSIPPAPSGANAVTKKNNGKQRAITELGSDDEEGEEEYDFLPQPATAIAPTSEPFVDTFGAASSSGGDGESSRTVGGGTDASELSVGVAASGGAVVGGSGRKFQPSKPAHLGYGGRVSTDVTLEGLINSVRAEEKSPMMASKLVHNPTELLKVLENVQHEALMKQPDCLTVQLFEHQLQATQWMYDQEVLEGGAMQHLWAELPPHPQMPANDDRSCEFRRCWYSPALNQFTVKNPFKAGTKGGLLCDEMGLGKTAATLALHLIHPPQTPSPGFPLDETEWRSITGKQATLMVAPKSTSGATKAPGKVVSKGTLVVCKVSLVGQWVEEAKRLCGGALSIYAYHGGYRKKDPALLAKFDMIVTTYGIVQVLDESHSLNHGSWSSNAVRELVANRRWCMTGYPAPRILPCHANDDNGTPFTSKFSDVNRQLAFVGVAGSFRDRDLGNKRPNTDTQVEVTVFLRRVVLRHSQGMKLGANSLLGLPTVTHKVEVLTLPPKELKAYHDFENTIQK
ncbi:unnamed protein product, partial [Ectocarpus sp. 12 AP-2014]